MKNKYHNKKVIIDGIKFDSKKEANRYKELIILQNAGKIKDLTLQKEYVLIPKQDGERKCSYIADFVYTDDKGQTIVEDVKAYSKTKKKYITTPDFKIKKKLMLWVHGIKITLV